MKEYVFKELGYFTESTINKLKENLNGKSFMNFEVTSSNYAGNHTLIIKTDYEESPEEIKAFFLNLALTNLCKEIELNEAKQKIKADLEGLGFEDNLSERITKVSSYYKGKPATVLLDDGLELYL